MSAERRALLARMLAEKGLGGAAPAAPRGVPRRTGDGPWPLEPNQEGLWFIDQLEPGQANYNIPGTVRLTGRLDVPALERTLTEIVRRHEMLRTSYGVGEDGVPFLAIAEPAPVPVPVTDLADLPPEEREARALELATEEARTPFDLAAGPLFRASLIRLSDSDHVLSLNFHHSASDGVSMRIFTRELEALYAGHAAGRPPVLPEVPLQYADFVAWQRERLSGSVLEEHLAFWREHLAGEVADLRLPTDRPRPTAQSFRGAHRTLTLTPDLTRALRRLAQREETTLYLPLLAAWDVLMSRSTGLEDVVVGSTWANREAPGLDGVIGFFANTLPFRVSLSGDPTFREIVARVKRASLAVHAHHEVPFATLVRQLSPGRDLGQNPFYRVVFDFLTPDLNPAIYGYGLSGAADERARLGPLTVSPVNVECGVARFDVAVFLWDMPDALSGTFEYSSDLFDDATIARMQELFAFLLAEVVRRPDARLSELVRRMDEEDRRLAGAEQASRRSALKGRLGKLRPRRSSGSG